MFYNKIIEIIEVIKGDEWAGTQDSENILKIIKADVQPITKEIAYKTYGYTTNVEFRIYCDFDNLIKLGTIIKYKNIKYQVIKILDWDNYIEILVDNYK